MLIIILILVCVLIFLSLLSLGEAILIRKLMPRNRVSQLPRVMPQILRTMAVETDRISKTGVQSEEAKRWAEELYMEQPCLAEFLKTAIANETNPGATAIVIYRLLKAQAEADSLADLTKIQK